jgi:hypothetical protein
MDLIVVTTPPEKEEIRRAVEFTNEELAALAMCVEAYADTYRGKHSVVVTTYVTRGQLSEAVAEATKMNALLQKLDELQARLMS